ncbi:MAG: DNA translocase FtsK [Verrucomicrobia bacterium]|nr:DNA translocase FtsK [Verrucomicrobiota bacterium]
MAQPWKHNGWNEVLGLIFLGFGTVLFLALISYTPKDIPSWIWFSNESPANNPAQNLIGPTGAVIAGFLYMTVGVASYLVVSILLGFGGAKLFFPGFQISKRLLWALVFVASGASMAHLQPWFLHSLTWKHEFVDLGPGGWVGSNLGGKLFQYALGQIGSVIALAIVYLVSLIWLTGIRPVLVVKQLLHGARDCLLRLKQARERRRLAAADERGRLEADQKRIRREIRRQEKELKRKGVPVGDPADEGAYPEPKIIDTSAVTPAKAGLSLADAKNGKPKEPSLPLPSQNIEHYELPSVDLLARIDVEVRKAADPAELKQTQSTLIDTLKQFNIEASPGDITRGPTITRYEVYPARGVRVDKISSLERDLARATRAERINILAPIPGKDTVGIEIANTKKIKVVLREILESEEWVHTSYRIPIVLGKDVYGKIILGDLAQMPHCLVAGTTGSGKSVCVNAIIASMLYRFRPDELRFVMIDPKVVEMQVYNTLPHLVMPVVTDPKKVLLALRWVINEMENRYKIFAKVNVRNITGFNSRPKPKSQKELDAEKAVSMDPDEVARDDGALRGTAEPAPVRVPRDDDLIVPDKMPFVVVIIDELADLMQTAPADVEAAIARITQMARAAGIHMIVATQTPRADVVTGVIKANIPTRIAFQVASALDSRVILDENGAERLLGQGDMFYRPPGTSRLVRSQGVLVTDEEIRELVDFVGAQALPMFDPDIQNQLASGGSSEEDDVTEEDEALVEKCLDIIRQEKRASTSMLQRRLRLGYTRAARVVDILERRGILGPGEGAKPREILIDLDALV